MPEIYRCPFCGSTNTLENQLAQTTARQCVTCEASAPSFVWNRFRESGTAVVPTLSVVDQGPLVDEALATRPPYREGAPLRMIEP